VTYAGFAGRNFAKSFTKTVRFDPLQVVDGQPLTARVVVLSSDFDDTTQTRSGASFLPLVSQVRAVENLPTLCILTEREHTSAPVREHSARQPDRLRLEP